jgi:SPP1 family predicted phage head-tail adaptor
MFDSFITLKKETNTINEYGDPVQTFAERNVFAEVLSIGQSEFYQAQATGLKPEIKFVIADFADYQNEKILSYKPFGASKAEDYTVLRTYRNKYNLEIVCKRGIE